MIDHSVYTSPFSWRYASPAMRALWSEEHRRLLWRRIWVALAKAQSTFGLVQEEQVADLIAHQNQIDLPRALEIEAEIHHDLMAEVRTYAEQCPLGGGIIHLGATSMDVEDNADALRLLEASRLVAGKLNQLLEELADKITRFAGLETIAFTHLQPAEPTTVGYRLAGMAQDLLSVRDHLEEAIASLKGKGFKGAVGTAASYIELLGEAGHARMEALLAADLALPFYPVTNQTSPRLQEYWLLSTLAGLGAVLNKFAFDLRILQSPVIGEWAEPFGRKQIGSSAMPFKRNPIHAEKIDSLSRQLSALPVNAWNNAAHSLLERTLDDSANRRTILPEAFLLSDELLETTLRLVKGLVIHEEAIHRNLARYAPFAATERVLMAAVKAGGNRQELHEVLRDLAMQAWPQVQRGEENPLIDLVAGDPRVNSLVTPEKIRALMSTGTYSGFARERALALAETIRSQKTA